MSIKTAKHGRGPTITSSSRAPHTESPLPAVPHSAARPERDQALTNAPLLGTRSGLPTILCYGLSDALCIVSVLVSVRLVLWMAGMAPSFGWHDPRLAVGFLAAAMILNWYQGLYSTVVLKPAAELRHIWINSLGLAAFFAAVQWVMMDMPTVHSSRLLWLAISSITMAIPLPLLRAGCRMLFGRKSWWGRRVILVGCGERSSELFSALRRGSVYGLRPVGFVEDFEHLPADSDHQGYLGPIAELVDRINECDVSLGLVASNGMGPRGEISHLVCRPNTGVADWLIVSDCTGLPCLWTSAREVGGMPALGLTNQLCCPWRRAVKRGFDLAIAMMVGPFVALAIGLVALWVKLISPGASPFFASTRIGRDGKRFKMWKLRTMVPNAEAVLHEYLEKHPELAEEYQRDHKLKNDPRVLPFGGLIRVTSLDELPQLWNIVTGEMSFVGPRPMLVNELERYGDTFEEYRLVSPGITGLWQVNGRNNTSYEDRLAYTDYYVKNWSLWLDLYILICTVKVVLLREGAY